MAKVKKLQPLKGKKPIAPKKPKVALVLATEPHATRLSKPKKIALHHAATKAHPVKNHLSKKTVW